MKQRSVRIIGEYLSQCPRSRIVQLKRTGPDDYALAIEDRRDGRTHLLRTPRDLQVCAWSFEARECLQPEVGLCGRCDRILGDRDLGGKIQQPRRY